MAKKPKLEIPQDGEELTAAWFNEVMPNTNGGRVTGVDRTIIGTGIGFLSELHRCQLQWDAADDSLPSSVIVKVPTKVDANRSVGEGMGAYEREIIVYRDLGDELGIRMPAYYYSELDPDPAPWLDRPLRWLLETLPIRAVGWLIMRLIALGGMSKRRYLLVMEDIHDARPPSQVVGGSVEDALEALDVLAAFHAHNWMSERPADASSRIWPIDRVPKIWQANYHRERDTFIGQFGEQLGPDVIARLDQVQAALPDLIGPLASAPWTLIHGDYRLDNLMYRPSGELVVLDFQLVGLGRAGWDVAYFITTALSPEHREHEPTMLERYHSALVAAGVDDYAYDQLLDDVNVTKLLLAHRMVGSGDTLDTQMDGHDESFVELLVERVVGWVR